MTDKDEKFFDPDRIWEEDHWTWWKAIFIATIICLLVWDVGGDAGWW